MRKLSVLTLLCFAVTTHAAEREIDLEAQVYPTGTIAAVGVKLPLGKDTRSITLRAGYNDVDRDDNGDRDDEKGGGQGISVGWRAMLADAERGWFASARADLWFLEIDWIDQPGTPGETRGTTDVIVLQPTGAVGYRKPFGKDRRWSFEPVMSRNSIVEFLT